MSPPLTIVRFIVATVGRKGRASHDTGLVTLDPAADSEVHPRYMTAMWYRMIDDKDMLQNVWTYPFYIEMFALDDDNDLTSG